ncbi:MAG: hypothetical protein WBF06_16710 [Candidatus Acidiferrales bacterium]
MFIVLSELTAEASFEDIFERIKAGMAIAAIIRMIATTINNSMSENPFCLFRTTSPQNLERHFRAEELDRYPVGIRASAVPHGHTADSRARHKRIILNRLEIQDLAM